MNKEKPFREQAERLRKRVDKKEHIAEQPTNDGALPPRSKVHHQKKKKTKWKLKYPLIRLLALFFILLPIVSFSLYTINENNKSITEPVINDQENIETVDVEDDTEVNDLTENKERDRQGNEQSGEMEVPSVNNEKSSTPSVNDKNASNDKVESNVNESKDSEGKMIYHKVQPNETLFRIAMKYYHSQSGIETIKQVNGIQGNEIRVGETLKIPIN